ncbi:alkaline phosphatase family protein [Rhizobium sp.]
MRRVVAVILDGLRRDFVSPEYTPNLAALKKHATWFENHRSAVPSVTRVCSSTFATGSYAANHGLEGNSLALKDGDSFTIHDAGRPDFLQHRRNVLGKSLLRPTLAERLADAGGAMIYSNVSPGAAYAHDPDGHGFVFHRVASYGPGRNVLEGAAALDIDWELSGDRAMSDRFIAEALTARQPALALMWLGHPDSTQHYFPLGSPEHLDALRQSDENVGRVIRRVAELRSAGEDILLIVGSDHGHETVHSVVDVAAEIASAGFAADVEAGGLVIVPNGTGVLIYATATGQARIPSLVDFLGKQPWAGELFAGERLKEIGQSSERGLAVYFSMASDQEPNEYGVKGRSFAAKPLFDKPDRLGCGQHGGLGIYEQAPFLLLDGEGFFENAHREESTSLVDIAPTILKYLNLPSEGCDGRPLQADRIYS